MKKFLFASAVALAFTFTGSTVVSCGGEKAAEEEKAAAVAVDDQLVSLIDGYTQKIKAAKSMEDLEKIADDMDVAFEKFVEMNMAAIEVIQKDEAKNDAAEKKVSEAMARFENAAIEKSKALNK